MNTPRSPPSGVEVSDFCYIHTMRFADGFIKVFRTLLPTPFTIAIALTLITFIVAFFYTRPADVGALDHIVDLAGYWEKGLWQNGLLVFAFQMMLMLILGHVLALTRPVNSLISTFTRTFCNNTANAAFTVTLLTVIVAWFNWGLGLVFGAIFARKVAEHASQLHIPLNYGLIGAAGYSGLMVWHGGISGSSLAKIAEPGHIKGLMVDIMPQAQIDLLPDAIGYNETVFGSMNIFVSIGLLVILPLCMWGIGRASQPKLISLPPSSLQSPKVEEPPEGAEVLDRSAIFAYIVGGLIIIMALYKALDHPHTKAMAFITPNWINLFLLGLGISLHASFHRFLKGVDEAIGGAAGILIQFPLYFGIMGIMKDSGLVEMISMKMVQISADTSNPSDYYPILTFFSAGLVNVFVPSGGGQWALQGPIIVNAAMGLKVPLTKSIMAMAYGDQLTNMLQPFWALPLLGITGLKARDILPYTLFLMLVGTVIFVTAILLF